jgi:hypothetical protein
MLYKYPQGEFPYARLIEENRQRGVKKPEFELLDTGFSTTTATSMCSSSTHRPRPKTS